MGVAVHDMDPSDTDGDDEHGPGSGDDDWWWDSVSAGEGAGYSDDDDDSGGLMRSDDEDNGGVRPQSLESTPRWWDALLTRPAQEQPPDGELPGEKVSPAGVLRQGPDYCVFVF